MAGMAKGLSGVNLIEKNSFKQRGKLHVDTKRCFQALLLFYQICCQIFTAFSQSH